MTMRYLQLTVLMSTKTDMEYPDLQNMQLIPCDVFGLPC